MSSQYITYKEAIATLPSPLLFLDLESLDKNIEWVAQNSGNKKIRIATKSIRSIELLKRIHEKNSLKICFYFSRIILTFTELMGNFNLVSNSGEQHLFLKF